MVQRIRIRSFLVALSISGLALGAVSPEEAKQLGGPELTEWGAERSGNKEDTIPPYTGTGVKPPASWNPKMPGQRPDPYDDRPLYSITAQNAAQYADKLDGMIEIFKRYPEFRMDIYPTHRDYVVPKYVRENTLKNATDCKALDKELRLEGCHGGMPFPIPKTGNQAMWNHLVGFNTFNLIGRAESWIVPSSGTPAMLDRGEYIFSYPFFDPDKSGPRTSDVIYQYFLAKEEEPARVAGQQMMIIDPIDQANIGRRAYLYMTGRRWVRLAADLAYDTPNPYTGGTSTMDDQRVFYGALDRYDFQLIGKKEKFIYYDNFQLTDARSCPTGKIVSTKGFPHPDCVRWELHRVWVVKATLKTGFRHLYTKRMFYWDEDGYIAGQGENYDKNDKLLRIATNHFYPLYETEGAHGGSNTFMDIVSGTWAIAGTTNCEGCGFYVPKDRFPESMFDPNMMAGSGVR